MRAKGSLEETAQQQSNGPEAKNGADARKQREARRNDEDGNNASLRVGKPNASAGRAERQDKRKQGRTEKRLPP